MLSLPLKFNSKSVVKMEPHSLEAGFTSLHRL